jgi:hypothetical protein
MGGRARRRWRFWRRALDVALCWRDEQQPYEPCETNDKNRPARYRGAPANGAYAFSDSIIDRAAAAGDDGVDKSALIDAQGNIDGDRRCARKQAPRAQVAGQSRGVSATVDVCHQSNMLARLAAMKQPIAVPCPSADDALYRVDLEEETLEYVRNNRRRSWSLTFYMDHKRTDDHRLTLYGLMAPECKAWSMAFVESRDPTDPVAYRTLVHVESGDPYDAID